MLVTEETSQRALVTPPRRRPGVIRWVLASALVVVAAGVLTVWWFTRPPAPVSVHDVVDRFRAASPTPAAQSIGGPAIGVYLYRTNGFERVSAGHVTHHYPSVTTLTVTPDPCGLKFRWDALAGRYGEWQVCRGSSAWSLVHYVDVHTFLYMKDVHDYSCSGFPTVVCTTDTGVLTSTVTDVGHEALMIGGASRTTTHVHIQQIATGKSISDGSIDAWILPTGLPARITVVDDGAQTVLGSRVNYHEEVTFLLASPKPRR